MGIFDNQLREGKMLAMLPAHKRKAEKAKADIIKMLELCQSPYVSLSWGKQSICLMHMVYTVNPNIEGVFWRGAETNIIADFDNVIKQFRAKWNINYQEQFCEYDFKNQARQWGIKNNKDGVFIGLVRDESKARRFTLAKADEHNIFAYKNETRRCCPLRYWSNTDIAAYVALYDLPMLSTYRKFGFDVRTSARIKIDGKSFTERGLDYLTSEQQEKLTQSKKGKYEQA